MAMEINYSFPLGVDNHRNKMNVYFFSALPFDIPNFPLQEKKRIFLSFLHPLNFLVPFFHAKLIDNVACIIQLACALVIIRQCIYKS